MKCCEMTAGMLRTDCLFERQNRVSDGAGGYTESWAAISGAPTRCHFKAMSGGERWASMRIEATSTARITVRYFSGLLESDRVTIGGRVYNIRFVNNVEMRNRWLVIDLGLGVAV